MVSERCAAAAQEPVEPLKKEYKQAVDSLEGSLGAEGTQKVRCALDDKSGPTTTHDVVIWLCWILHVTRNAVAITVSAGFAWRMPFDTYMYLYRHSLCPIALI